MEKNELAKTMIKDGQAMRAIINYLSETFNGIKSVAFWGDRFENESDFFEYVGNSCLSWANDLKTIQKEEENDVSDF